MHISEKICLRTLCSSREFKDAFKRRVSTCPEKVVFRKSLTGTGTEIGRTEKLIVGQFRLLGNASRKKKA